MKIKALLFDLDDTLLINDTEQFLRPYFALLVSKVTDLCPAEQFMNALSKGTAAMMRNDGSLGSNAEAFFSEFYSRVQVDPEVLTPRLEAFYAEDFDSLRVHSAVDPDARPVVDEASARGYQLAVATQPIFPLSAIEARLNWAGVGVDEVAYDFVAHYEGMGAAKPHPHFWEIVLAHLGREPGECLMVGDSAQYDMPAREYGLKTFWVDRGRPDSPPPKVADARGSLADLYRLLTTGEIDEL